MKQITVRPAYGRDYTSATAAIKDFDAEKDWIVNDISSRWNGAYVNKQQLPAYSVKIRFNKLRSCTIVDVP